MASATKRIILSSGWVKIAEAKGREAMAMIDAYGAVQLAVADGEPPRGDVASGHSLNGSMMWPVKGAEIIWARGAGVAVSVTLLKVVPEFATLDSAALKVATASAQAVATAAAGAAATADATAAAADAKATEAQTVAANARRAAGPIPQEFGAVGDGVTDDTAALQAWVDYVVANSVTGVLPAGTYLATTLDMYPYLSYAIRGDGDRQSVINIDNPDRNGVGLKFTHPSNPQTRGQPYQISDIGVGAEAGTKACLIEDRYAGGSKWNRIRVRGYHGGTGIRMEKLWNVDMSEVSVWGCGHNIPAKTVPEGVTFSIGPSTTTLTASGPVFSADDVGRTLTLGASASTTPQTFQIVGYTDPQTATVGATRKRVYSNVPGSFGGVRGSMTASSNVLTLEADVLTSDDIGRKVYVVGAALNGSMPRPLPATITGVSGTSVTLSAQAQRAVTLAELVFDPAVDFGDADYSVAQKTNDFYCSGLHIEHHRGCGLVVTGVSLSMPSMKLHASGHTAINDMATNIQMLSYDAYGTISGTFEQVVASNVGRILITGSDAPLSMQWIETMLTHDMPTVCMQYCGNGAALDIGTIKGLGTDQNQNAMDGCLSTDGTGLIMARLIGAPGQSYRRMNVVIPTP